MGGYEANPPTGPYFALASPQRPIDAEDNTGLKDKSEVEDGGKDARTYSSKSSRGKSSSAESCSDQPEAHESLDRSLLNSKSITVAPVKKDREGHSEYENPAHSEKGELVLPLVPLPTL